MEVKKLTIGNMDNNCYLLTDEKSGECALIDCPDFNDEVEAFIGDKKPKYILLTHGHYDHILGVKKAREKYGSLVYIGEKDAQMLESSKLSLAVFCMRDRTQEPTKADFFLRDGKVIMLGDLEIKVMSTPGHTQGSVCYICENVIFTGDTLFRLSYGRTDFPGGSMMDMKNSLKKLANLDGDYIVYAGHGKDSTLDFERQHNELLR